MTTDNNQSLLTDRQILALSNVYLKAHAQFVGAGEVYIDGTEDFARAIIRAVLSKLRGAGEPVYVDAGHLREVLNGNDMPISASSDPQHGMVALYAAPQASAEVRDAALEEAAVICDRLAQLVGRSGGAGALAKEIRALKSAPAAEGKREVGDD